MERNRIIILSDGKGRGLTSFVGWVSYNLFVAILAEVCSKEGGQLCMAMERLENLSDEVTEGRSNVRVEESQVERGGWIVNS